MCIFSRSVRYVANTRIFARLSETGTQFLAYQMRFGSDQGLAMLLPLPVARPAGSCSVRFINLKGYPDFFDHLENGFPQPIDPDTKGMGGAAAGAAPPTATLPVMQVGSFVASFVVTLADFDRLSPQFKHDGQVHAYEEFDHQLYVQDARLHFSDERDSWGNPRPAISEYRFVSSDTRAGRFTDVVRAKGIVDPSRVVMKRTLRGRLPNRDTIVPTG